MVNNKILFLATVDVYICYFHIPFMKLLRDIGYTVEVADGVTGFLVNSDDVEGLASILILLLDNSELCVKMGTAGKLRASEHFSLYRMVSEYESLYKKLFNVYYRKR